jgi:uncharacterized protein (TIGR02687 family)
MSSIAEALKKRFAEYRVIFWYDALAELQKEYEHAVLPGVEKVHVQGNEFAVKYLTNKQQPTDKFLLYFTSPKPANEDNWLLDMELAHYVFHTDQEAMWLQEMGLGLHLKDLVAAHMEFFRAKERRNKLRELLGDGDGHQDIRYKMLCVLFRTDDLDLDTYVLAQATALAEGKDTYDGELERYKLAEFYWHEVARKYQYTSDQPSIYDLLLDLFSGEFILGAKAKPRTSARLLLAKWRDSMKYRKAYGILSARIATDLGVVARLQLAEPEVLLEDELFELTDKRIIHGVAERLVAGGISHENVARIIKARENKYWYSEVQAIYGALGHAAQLIALVDKYGKMRYASFEEGITHYSTEAFAVDQEYRKFIFSYRATNQNRVLADLAAKVERVYSNDWLLNYSNNWQRMVDGLGTWPVAERRSQRRFFQEHVQPYIQKDLRVFVIISDALRYECGEELCRLLQAEDRYEATVEPMVASLPTYTQLGMASLLPHTQLALKEGSDQIIADDMSTLGAEGRDKVLKANAGVRAVAIKAEDFMALNAAKEGREFVKEHDVIYIYHNRIDKTGDDKTSEERVFEAVEDELAYLLNVVKKVNNMNAYHMLITADHGFIYQHTELADSDYTTSGHTGKVWRENRRFVIGEQLVGDAATKAFTGEQVGLASPVDVLVPKSINRLRIKGSGARFVHGGATLQEVVVPVVRVNKRRQSTTTQVDIDIIKSTDRITTNILAVSFIQTELVTEQVLPRKLRALIMAEDGEVLSDQFVYTFDVAEGSERQREVKHRFQLSAKASGKYKNQRVKLVLEEPVDGTAKWRHYRDYYYTLNISFTSDFDE